MSETPRQKFLRNHYENVRIMRASQKRAEQEGRTEDAARIREIADAWEGIGERAEDEEKGATP